MIILACIFFVLGLAVFFFGTWIYVNEPLNIRARRVCDIGCGGLLLLSLLAYQCR